MRDLDNQEPDSHQDFRRGYLACARLVMKSIEANTIIFAAHAGAPLKAAYATGKAVAAMTVFEISDHLDPELEWIETEAIDEVNWPVIAAKAGEPIDFAAWEAWAAEKFPGQDGEP